MHRLAQLIALKKLCDKNLECAKNTIPKFKAQSDDLQNYLDKNSENGIYKNDYCYIMNDEYISALTTIVEYAMKINNTMEDFIELSKRFNADHSENASEASTKSDTKCTTVVEQILPQLKIEPSSVINITVTYIDSITSFYARINGDGPIEFLAWSYGDLPAAKHLKTPTKDRPYVLAKHPDDHLYYRAKLLKKVDQNNFLVLHLDYGNQCTVPLNDLAECDKLSLSKPAQAYLMYIDGINVKEDICEEKINYGIEFLRQKILHKKLNVHVLQSYEQCLIIRFFEDYRFLPNKLINTECAVPVDKKRMFRRN